MKADQIKDILNSGDYKKKIKLYLTEIAGLNTEGEEFLTQDQRLEIVTKLKGKEIDYYNKLIQYNRAFIMYKNLLLAYSISIESYCYKITLYFMTVNYDTMLIERKGLIGAMDDSITKAIKEARLELLKLKTTPDWIKNIDYKDSLDNLNKEIAEFKELLEKSKVVLKNYLPLKPYQNYLKNLELKVIQVLKNLEDFIETEWTIKNAQAKANAFISYPKYKRNKKNVPINTEDNLSIAESIKLIFNPESVISLEISNTTGIIVYDKLTVKVLKVDIEEYINAGI